MRASVASYRGPHCFNWERIANQPQSVVGNCCVVFHINFPPLWWGKYIYTANKQTNYGLRNFCFDFSNKTSSYSFIRSCSCRRCCRCSIQMAQIINKRSVKDAGSPPHNSIYEFGFLFTNSKRSEFSAHRMCFVFVMCKRIKSHFDARSYHLAGIQHLSFFPIKFVYDGVVKNCKCFV